MKTSKKKRIGELLVDCGILSTEDVKKILAESLASRKRFCETGISLGLLSQHSVIQAFAPGFKGDFLNLSSSHLNIDTSEPLSLAEVVKLGALPIGFKKETRFLGKNRRRSFSFGMINPTQLKTVLDVLQLKSPANRRKDPLSSGKAYLVLVDQFWELLSESFKVSEDDLRKFSPDQIHPVLRDFLNISSGNEELLRRAA